MAVEHFKAYRSPSGDLHFPKRVAMLQTPIPEVSPADPLVEQTGIRILAKISAGKDAYRIPSERGEAFLAPNSIRVERSLVGENTVYSADDIPQK